MKSENEQLRIEARDLQNDCPTDLATMVETMWASYEQHFANPALAQGIGGKRAEVEQAFASMAGLLRQLSAFDLTLKACNEQAAAAAAAPAAAPASSTALVATTPPPGGADIRSTGHKAVRDSTDDELLERRRAVRIKTVADGSETAVSIWEPDI